MSLAALTIAFGVFAVVALGRDRDLRRAIAGVGAAAAFSLLLLLPHVSGLPASGEGGRLLYTTIALLAVSSGLVASSLDTLRGTQRAPALACGVLCIAIIALNARLLDASLATWRNRRRPDDPARPCTRDGCGEVDPSGYAFVVAPDAIGAAPFARNAEGAMTIPPIQRMWLLDRVIVYTSSDLASLPDRLVMPVIPILKRLRRNGTGDQLVDVSPAASTEKLVLPSALFCWDPDTAALRRVPLTSADPPDAQRWLAAARAALRSAGCRYVAEF